MVLDGFLFCFLFHAKGLYSCRAVSVLFFIKDYVSDLVAFLGFLLRILSVFVIRFPQGGLQDAKTRRGAYRLFPDPV